MKKAKEYILYDIIFINFYNVKAFRKEQKSIW